MSTLKNISAVIEGTQNLKEYLRGYKKEIYEELEMLAKKYPDKKITEVLNIREVYEPYIIGARNFVDKYAEQRDSHLININKIICSRNPELESETIELQKECNRIIRTNVNIQKREYCIKKLYEDFLKQHNLQELKKFVLDELDKLPETENNKDSFLSLLSDIILPIN